MDTSVHPPSFCQIHIPKHSSNASSFSAFLWNCFRVLTSLSMIMSSLKVGRPEQPANSQCWRGRLPCCSIIAFYVKSILWIPLNQLPTKFKRSSSDGFVVCFVVEAIKGSTIAAIICWCVGTIVIIWWSCTSQLPITWWKTRLHFSLKLLWIIIYTHADFNAIYSPHTFLLHLHIDYNNHMERDNINCPRHHLRRIICLHQKYWKELLFITLGFKSQLYYIEDIREHRPSTPWSISQGPS